MALRPRLSAGLPLSKKLAHNALVDALEGRERFAGGRRENRGTLPLKPRICFAAGQVGEKKVHENCGLTRTAITKWHGPFALDRYS
jgi:hypothetical protein